ncbi:MAG: hypothetical protein CMC88_08015 [Flavobacteriaceae bacterium]|nr:hypothetical protein [Flavobacteriaceae bacterium]|tara:strand:- start:149980 stop:150879 length:900 start_codon:yes stop_codon:yes gene_type:complete
MKPYLIVLIGLLLTTSIYSQNKKKTDKDAIKKMCGCFEVTFNFAETFKYSKNDEYSPSKNYSTSGLEWAQLVKDSKNNIIIQHILLVGNPAKPYVMKHWRQDWLYENKDFYIYDSNNKWTYKKKNKTQVKGQWTQKVYQVDDSPRYEGSSSWVHIDGKSFWENTTSAPLPRREYSKRNDYNVLLRGNRQEITKKGWVHDQDNFKIISEKGKKDEIIAMEKGINNYLRVNEKKCQAAKEWWEKNSKKWSHVRNSWNKVYSENKDISLKSEVQGKKLYEYLFSDKMNNKNEMEKVIFSFIQ